MFNKVKRHEQCLQSPSYSLLSLLVLFLSIYCFRISSILTRTIRNLLLFSTNFSLSSPNEIRIFDTWIYNHEADIVYIQIWRLYKYVDYFVILVSNTTFSGIKRGITFSPYEKELEQYQDKICIVSLPHQLRNRYISPSQFLNKIWCFEKTARDYSLQAIRSLFGLKMSDLILVSDLDEIFTREAMEYIIQNPPETYYYARGYMYFPYYYHIIENWNYDLVLRYDPKYFALSRFRSKYPQPMIGYLRAIIVVRKSIVRMVTIFQLKIGEI